MSWRFKIITAPNTTPLCYSSRPQLCLPNDRWCTVQCKPHSVLLKTPDEHGLKRFHWNFCSDQKQFETNKTNHAEASYLDLWILTSCQPQRGTVEQITYSVFFNTTTPTPPPPHAHTHITKSQARTWITALLTTQVTSKRGQAGYSTVTKNMSEYLHYTYSKLTFSDKFSTYSTQNQKPM